MKNLRLTGDSQKLQTIYLKQMDINYKNKVPSWQALNMEIASKINALFTE